MLTFALTAAAAKDAAAAVVTFPSGISASCFLTASGFSLGILSAVSLSSVFSPSSPVLSSSLDASSLFGSPTASWESSLLVSCVG